MAAHRASEGLSVGRQARNVKEPLSGDAALEPRRARIARELTNRKDETACRSSALALRCERQ